MEEGSKVRLVRCPKCENLLPELPDFSVYQCGGCGALLRTEKLDEEGGGRGVGEGLGVCIESGLGSERVSLESCRQKDGASSSTNANLVGSSSARTEDNPTMSALNFSRDRMSKEGKGVYCGDRYPHESKGLVNNGVNGNYQEMSVARERSEHGRPGLENEGRYGTRGGAFPGSLRSRPTMEKWDVEREGSMGFRGRGGGSEDQRKFPSFPYNDLGPSNYQRGPFYSSAEQKRIHHDMDGPSRVENLENDRAELLRKLDELQDQIKRYDVTDKPPFHVPPPPESSVLPTRSYVSQGSTNTYNVNRQTAVEHPYFNHHKGPAAYVSGRYGGMQDFHPQRNAPNEVLSHRGSYLLQSSKPPYEPPSRYLMRPNEEHFNQSSHASHRHRHDTFLHHPTCSCLQCYNQNQQVPSAFVSSRRTNDHLANSVTYDPWSYNTGGTNSSHRHLLTEQNKVRGSTYSNLDGGGLANQHSTRAVVARGRERVCRPLAGGAPFITCQACFDLLELPRKLMMAQNQQKVRCGGCSVVILIKLGKEGLFVSVPTEFENTLTRGDDGSDETLNESIQNPVNCLNAGAIESCSDDFDNTGYNFQLTETEYVVPIDQQKLNIGDSPCSSFSEDDQSPDSVIIQDMCDAADLPLEDEVPLPFQAPDNGPSSNVVSRNGAGNKSKRDGHEKIPLDRINSRQNSLKDVSLATEEAICFDEAPNVAISRESSKESKEEDRRRTNKGSESFLAGLIKKSFKDLSIRSSQSSETGKANVFVNGYPISDRVVKKAEKIAGPIQPGNYWYDYQAGFWGVIGHPCLGIIPPFIEEFNIPLPDDCASGNTGVYVNGRELNVNDLNLLASRGLPTARDRYYIVEISGKVVDEYTGEELDGLGKLAPTVEKANHGFGMKVPRALAQRRS